MAKGGALTQGLKVFSLSLVWKQRELLLAVRTFPAAVQGSQGSGLVPARGWGRRLALEDVGAEPFVPLAGRGHARQRCSRDVRCSCGEKVVPGPRRALDRGKGMMSTTGGANSAPRLLPPASHPRPAP